MLLRFSCRAFLIAAASVACASKLHTGNSLTPVLASQELNRCLSVVRAAVRKGAGSGPAQPARPDSPFHPLH